LHGKRLIQRTTAGSQGLLRFSDAGPLLAGCLANLTATVQFLKACRPSSVTLVQSGIHPGGWGDEDVACADAIEGLLVGIPPDPAAIAHRVRTSKSGRHYSEPDHPIFPQADLDLALELDRFPWPLLVTQNKEGHLVMKPARSVAAA
jgi:2-phosphosulfolactate phosphatase